MPVNFDQKRVLVTGGNRGLGRAFSECLAAAGAEVIVHSSGRDDSGAQLVDSIRQQGGKADSLSMPLEDGEALVTAALATAGNIDGIIHCAGIIRDSSIAKLDQSHWDSVLNIHLTIAYQLSRSIWPVFRQQRFGRLVFVSSAAGLYGNFGQANYAAAKMGLYGLCNTLAIEGKKYNIGVNAIAPWGATDMNRAQMDETMQRRVRAEQVAPLAAYLCHSDCTESGSLFEAGAGRFKKLRWERSAGLSLQSAENPTIDDIAAGWGQLTDFSASEHPQAINDALLGLMD